LLEGYQAAAASVYRWYRDEIGQWDQYCAVQEGGEFYSRMDAKIKEIEPGANGLVVLPYFATAATPRYNPNARGLILGLSFAHNRYHLARAFMEGITLDMKDMLNSMIASGIPISEARILGGPTKSAVWNQIQADVYGVPVTTLAISDATVLGAAILGGVGAGVFCSIQEGSDSMVRLQETFEPIPANVQVYGQLYDVFSSTYEALEGKGVFTSLASLQKG
jgi:xylulokinase